MSINSNSNRNSKYQILETAPSNIALIKYMGKLAGSENLPTNPSLSYTLKNLKTCVVIKESFTKIPLDQWKALDSNFQLTKKAQERFLKHWEYLKKTFGIKGSYIISSTNNFPASCGLASSASSFAALTKAAYQVSLDQGGTKLNLIDLANLSRKGSGSSCRSFFSPWAQWQGKDIQTLTVHKDYLQLKHSVLLVSTEEKKVSSSEAHNRVLEHLDFLNRIKRSEERFLKLKNLLTKPDQFLIIKDLVWKEFMDMHQLFETCPKAFSYFTPTVKSLLQDLDHFIVTQKAPLWVTMDAGPNIHLLYQSQEEEKIKTHLSQLTKQYNLINTTVFNQGKHV